MKKKRKKLGRQLLSFLLTLAMLVGLMPGMSLTAYAADVPYASLKNTTNVITFDNKQWYLIDYDESTVTLLTKECVEKSAYNNVDWTFVPYDNSIIKGVVDTWYSNHITENAKTAVNGNGMFLLTTEQANKINKEVRKCPKYSEEMGNYHWWLCSRSSESDMFNYCAAFVDGADGYVDGDGANTGDVFGVRPALKLNLESVTFSSVNLSGGANATISEGTATQNYFDVGNTRGAMTQVTYTANANYKFPETSELYKTTNGITVTRTSDTEITVSGVPTATATSIAIPDAVDSRIAQTVTAPTEASGLTYKKDQAQALLASGAVVTEGNKTEGSVQYRVGTDGEWSTEIPTGTNAGTYSVYYKVLGDETYAEYAPADPISVTIAKADPVTPTGMTGKYGQTLSTVSLPGGWSWDDNDIIMIDGVGNYTYQANYNPTDATNYNSLSDVGLTVKVGKGVGTISFGQTEVESTIGAEPPYVYFESTGDGVVTFTSYNENVATVNDNGYLNIKGVGETTITASVVDSDTYHYATKSVSYKLIVKKRSASIKTVPTASEITYGQTLADSTLSGGEVYGNIEGNFSWADSGIAPAVSDSETTEYAVKFTPKNSDIFAESTCKVKVKVKKAPAPATKESLLPEQKPAAKNADDLVYTGEAIELVTAPTTDLPTDYEAYYSTDDGGTWSKDIPKKKGPGSNTVKVKYVSKSGNYEDIQLDDISVTITVDKSILGKAIKEANDYKDEITNKNTDNIYEDVISTLGTAISTAESENIKQDSSDADVVSAIDALTTALNKAKADVKDIDDQRAADAVITLINALPDANEVTIEDKDDIEDARAAYNSLTGDQKNKVTNLEKLTNAENAWVTVYRNAKKNDADGLVYEDDSKAAKDLVTNAKNDIDNITYDQSKGLDVFKAAVDAIITKVTADVADQKEADKITTLINALPDADQVTTGDKNAIEAARAAYKYLSDGQKSKVTDETLKKLTDAEDALAAAIVSDTINALPDKNQVKTEDKDKIEAARKAYNALTDGQKSKVTDETLKKLTDAEAALKDLVDAAEAKKVADKIDKLPSSDKVALTDKESIEEARKAYDALTDGQKDKVTPETLKKLTDAEDRLKILQVMSEVSAKTGSSVTYTGNPIQLINTPTTALPAGYTMKYAVTTENVKPTDEKLYTTEIPTKTEVGTYYVWYKVVGDENHTDVEPKSLVVTINEKQQTSNGTISTTGIYCASNYPTIQAGINVQKSNEEDAVEYRWVACDTKEPLNWFEVSPWTKDNNWMDWKPEKSGAYVLVCYARVVGNEEESLIQYAFGTEYHSGIKGICQIPYTGEGGGYLIGLESYINPNNSFQYEMLILDCNLYIQNKDPWVYSTGKCGSLSNCLWTVWQPKYGYYWTLFRIYDADGNMIDEQCYGFANVN